MEHALAIRIINRQMELARRDFAKNGTLPDLMIGVYIGTMQSYAEQTGTMEAYALANKYRLELMEMNKPVKAEEIA